MNNNEEKVLLNFQKSYSYKKTTNLNSYISFQALNKYYLYLLNVF